MTTNKAPDLSARFLKLREKYCYSLPQGEIDDCCECCELLLELWKDFQAISQDKECASCGHVMTMACPLCNGTRQKEGA